MKTLRASYNGSKGREVGLILDVLRQNVEIKDVRTAVDPFSGRAHVAYAFKQLGLAVTACDRLASAAGWAKGVVESDNVVLTEDDLVELLAPATRTVPVFVEENFCLTHRGAIQKISLENARLAQHYLANTERLPQSKRALARALLATTVYDCLPYANENHAHPERTVYDLGQKLIKRLRDINSCIVAGKQPCCALWANAVAHLASSHYDLAYFDPPYCIDRRVYECQLVESLAQGRFVHREELPNSFDRKESARDALRALFEAADAAAAIWVLSYNTTAEISVRELAHMMTRHRMVQSHAFPHRMVIVTKQQSANRCGETKEVILLGLPYPRKYRAFARHAKHYQEDCELINGEGEWHTCLLPREEIDQKLPSPPPTRRITRHVIIDTISSVGLDEARQKAITWKIRDMVKAGEDSRFETKVDRHHYVEQLRSGFKQEPTGILAALRSRNAIDRYSALMETLERPGSYEQHCGQELLEALRFVIMNPLPDPPPPYREGDDIYLQLAGEDRAMAAICLYQIASTDALAVLEECQSGDGGLTAIIEEWNGFGGDTPEPDRKTFSDDDMALAEHSAPESAAITMENRRET